MSRRRYFRRHRRRGFTLIELIASATLMAIMAAVLAGVLWSIQRQTVSLSRQSASAAPTAIAIETVRDDLINARGYRRTERGLDLRGFFPPSYTFGTIRYAIVNEPPAAGANERAIGSLVRFGDAGPRVVWHDIGSLTFAPLGGRPAAASGWTEIPPRVVVTMIGGDKQTLWREQLRHHED